MTTFWTYPEYEGLTTSYGKGIVVVEELAPSIERLAAIGTALGASQEVVTMARLI